MTDHYTQKVEVAAPKGEQAKHLAGTVLKLMALGLILVAVFANYYVFIAVAVLFLLGVVLSQMYNNNAKEYEYDFNTMRFVVCRTNMLGKRERKLEVLFSDVKEFFRFVDLVCADDLIFCGSTADSGIYAMTFVFEDKLRRVLFAPDDYLVALIEETLANLKKES